MCPWEDKADATILMGKLWIASEYGCRDLNLKITSRPIKTEIFVPGYVRPCWRVTCAERKTERKKETGKEEGRIQSLNKQLSVWRHHKDTTWRHSRNKTSGHKRSTRNFAIKMLSENRMVHIQFRILEILSCLASNYVSWPQRQRNAPPTMYIGGVEVAHTWRINWSS
jgi:hypothetical protein